MIVSASTSCFLLGSKPEGTISLFSIGTREEESFAAIREIRLCGMAMEAAKARLYRGEQLVAGVKIYPYEVS